jgi:hypothetical protein
VRLTTTDKRLPSGPAHLGQSGEDNMADIIEARQRRRRDLLPRCPSYGCLACDPALVSTPSFCTMAISIVFW